MNKIKTFFSDWTMFEKCWLVLSAVTMVVLSLVWGDSLLALLSGLAGIISVVLCAKGKILKSPEPDSEGLGDSDCRFYCRSGSILWNLKSSGRRICPGRCNIYGAEHDRFHLNGCPLFRTVGYVGGCKCCICGAVAACTDQR